MCILYVWYGKYNWLIYKKKCIHRLFKEFPKHGFKGWEFVWPFYSKLAALNFAWLPFSPRKIATHGFDFSLRNFEKSKNTRAIVKLAKPLCVWFALTLSFTFFGYRMNTYSLTVLFSFAASFWTCWPAVPERPFAFNCIY